MNLNIKRSLYIALVLVLLLSKPMNAATRPAPVRSEPALAQTGGDMTEDDEQNLVAAAQAMRRSGLVQFNFKDMDLVRFMRFMSEVLQENIIVPPNINSKITIISPHPVR